MSTDPNPPTSGDRPLLAYAAAAPASIPTSVETSTAIFHDDAILIAINGATLPATCMLCGQPSIASALRLTFTWDASFTLTRDSSLQLRQKAIIHGFLCPPHQARYSNGKLIGGVGALGSFLFTLVGLALAVLSESSSVPDYTAQGITLTIFGFAGVIFSLFFLAFRTRTLSCQMIRDNYVYLEGADPAFLAQLPPLPSTIDLANTSVPHIASE